MAHILEFSVTKVAKVTRTVARRVLPFPLALLMAACGDDSSTVPSKPELKGESFVLVHGSWNAAWIWKDVAAELQQEGAIVTTVNMAAHGDDPTPVAKASLATYVDEVLSAVDAADGPVVLVGHSFGGTVISQAAEERPQKIDRLIYVGAFVPADGESTLDLALTDTDSLLGPALQIDATNGLAAVAKNDFASIFCADCGEAASALLTEKYRDEPLLPLTEKVSLTSGAFGTTAKYYVHTSLDHVISPSLQERMTSRLTLSGSATVATSHSPFLSAPGELATTLAALAKE